MAPWAKPIRKSATAQEMSFFIVEKNEWVKCAVELVAVVVPLRVVHRAVGFETVGDLSRSRIGFFENLDIELAVGGVNQDALDIIDPLIGRDDNGLFLSEHENFRASGNGDPF